MIKLDDIIDNVSAYIPRTETGLIEKAYRFSAKMHEGQKRLSGEPYLCHPLEVAYIMSKLRLDLPSIAAGLLHDTIEDTPASYDDIKKMFGEDVANIVEGVTKLSKISYQTKIQKQADYIRKMILAMSKDMRVLLVKLADRLHNMRTLKFMKEERRRAIAQETLDIYSPLAARLGIDWVKRELEDLCFMYLHPDEYEALKKAIAETIGEKQGFIEEVQEILARKMAEYGISSRILGRPKHYYSIYRKMKTRNVGLDQIYDLIAFRILVNSTKECYGALGIVHELWRPISGRFKDYISLPKANGYQSLHTTVVGHKGERMEIQIRTFDMDKVAREGIAAHWLYKEGNIVTDNRKQQFDWLSQLMEWQKELQDPRQFMESVKLDLFQNEVYVFTPKGDVKELPQGATPIDFAYSIHTEVGHHCSGAKVNGVLVPLRYELENGDVVEVITSNHHNPSRDWLKFVKTSKAVARIRQYLQNEERKKSLVLGKELCSSEFKKNRIDLNEVIKEKGDVLVRFFNYKTLEDLYVAVGFGKVSASHIAKRALKEISAKVPETDEAVIEKVVTGKLESLSKAPITIDGVDNIIFHIAHCCSPIPGDNVIGFITRGKGITVHSDRCRNLKRLDTERIVDINWNSTIGMTYPVKLKVETLDQKGILAAVSNAISASEANIIEARAKTIPAQVALLEFVVGVSDLKQLKRVIANVLKISQVNNVERVYS